MTPEHIFIVASALIDLPPYHAPIIVYTVSLKHVICLICRWTHVGYAEMGGVGNEEEAAARMSAALGLPSYPLPVNETLRLCTWLKSRPASSGYLGEQASLEAKYEVTVLTSSCFLVQPKFMYMYVYLSLQ